MLPLLRLLLAGLPGADAPAKSDLVETAASPTARVPRPARIQLAGFHSSMGRLASVRNGSATFCPVPAEA
jgi:hypothetical protein